MHSSLHEWTQVDRMEERIQKEKHRGQTDVKVIQVRLQRERNTVEGLEQILGH